MIQVKKVELTESQKVALAAFKERLEAKGFKRPFIKRKKRN